MMSVTISATSAWPSLLADGVERLDELVAPLAEVLADGLDLGDPQRVRRRPRSPSRRA